MKKQLPAKQLLAVLGTLALAGSAHAQFTPIAVSGYNHDLVVEAAAPPPLKSAINATMDGGTNLAGNTWYEAGYNTLAPTHGVPVHNTTIGPTAVGGLNYSFTMPPDYHVNCCILVGHNNGGRTWNTAPDAAHPGTLTFTTPAAFHSLAFLTAAGNGPVNVDYIIHHTGGGMESGTFAAPDWFLNPNANKVYNSAGRLTMDGGGNGGPQNEGANPAGALSEETVPLADQVNNVTSIDFFYHNSGGTTGSFTTGNTNNNGRAVIFAVSGTTDDLNFNPIAVTGWNADTVMEADGPQSFGTGVASGSTLTNNVTMTMDGGVSKNNFTWYEKGYLASFPDTGLPAAGSTISSATLPATYNMPSSYVGPNAFALCAPNTAGSGFPGVSNVTITFTTPAAYGALSFLASMGNGDFSIPCTVNFQDGTSSNEVIFVPDWFNRVIPEAYLAFGGVNVTNRTINNDKAGFVDLFTPRAPSPFINEFRSLGLPVRRLFDCVITISNASPITSVTLYMTNAAPANNSTRVACVFAVSGAAAGSVPPVFGYAGTALQGQPYAVATGPYTITGNSRARALRNGFNVGNVTAVKTWEGSNNIVINVTNVAGSGPISYQWRKAPIGQNTFYDIFYSVKYGNFTPLSDGGRISGSGTSTLTISNALVADTGDYLVTASNAGGSVTSLVVTAMLLSSNASVLVGVPAGDTIVQAPFDCGTTPVIETLDHVIDQVQQKWLNDGEVNCAFNPCCGGTITPFIGPVGYIVTPVSGASYVTAMRFFTANDTTTRDPLDYGLEGSNDGSTWSFITGGLLKGTLAMPTVRGLTGTAALDPLNQTNVVEVDFANVTSYTKYRVTITNTVDDFGTPLMQIGEIQLLGTFVPAPPIWTRQPGDSCVADVRVFVGSSPNFVAKATGLGALAPTYRWYKNGGTLIAGATSTLYTFPNAQLADSGTTFYCTASNSSGLITSTSATLSVSNAPTQSYPAAVLSDTPIAYWRLNEGPDNGSGNEGVWAHDWRGGYNGYYSNNDLTVPGYNPASDPDTCADFGTFNSLTSDSYVADIKDVTFAHAANTGGGTFSVEAWAYGGSGVVVNSAVLTKGYNGILTVGTGTGTEQFAIDVTGNTKNFRFLVRDALGNGYVAQSGAVPPDPFGNPTWHHLVGVCNQPAGTVQLYVDGVLAGSGTIPTTAGIETQPDAMTIGSRKSSGGATDYDNQWAGRIDDVALYSNALSSARVLAHYYAAQRPPVFSLHPVNLDTNDNSTAVFTSSAYGPGTVTYQWYNSDGTQPTTPIGGQMSANYSFTATPAANGNYYQVIAANAYGSVTSLVAQLIVESGPPGFKFGDLPASQTVYLAHVIQLKVSPSGTAPFTYQWQRAGTNLLDDYRTAGTQTDTLTMGYAGYPDSANYNCQVTGTATTSSTVDALTVTTNTGGFFTGGSSAADWSLQGTTAPVFTSAGNSSTIQLTAGLGNTERTAFLINKQSIGSFQATFTYQDVSGVNGADGVTFCIQNQAVNAQGGGGGSLGVANPSIAPSVELCLNIYSPNTRGISLNTGGAVGPYSTLTPNVGIGDNTDPVRVDLSYNGTVLTAKFTDTVTALTVTSNFTVNIPSIVGAATAWVGFTGADGGVASTQTVSYNLASSTRIGITVKLVGSNLVLTWPSASGAYLQTAPALGNPAAWIYDAVDTFRVVNGTNATVTVPPAAADQFFRLQLFP